MLILSLGVSYAPTSVSAATSSPSATIKVTDASAFLVDLEAQVLAKRSELGKLKRQESTASDKVGRKLKRYFGLAREKSPKQQIQAKIAHVTKEISILEACRNIAGENPGFLKKAWVKIRKFTMTHNVATGATLTLATAALVVSIYSYVTYGDMGLWNELTSYLPTVSDYLPTYASAGEKLSGLGNTLSEWGQKAWSYVPSWSSAASETVTEIPTTVNSTVIETVTEATTQTAENIASTVTETVTAGSERVLHELAQASTSSADTVEAAACYSPWNVAGWLGDKIAGRKC